MPQIRPMSSYSSLPLTALFGLLGSTLALGCGPRFELSGPGVDPADSATAVAPKLGPVSETAPGAAPGAAADPEPAPVVAAVRPAHARTILVGEMCPQGSNGRPAVIPLFLRSTTWSVHGDDVSLPIERRTARSFSVLSWQGRRSGVFSVAGGAEIGLDRRVAIGAYAGESPCAVWHDGSPDGASGGPSQRPIDATCAKFQAECGLALAEVDSSAMRPYDEDPEPLELSVTGACVARDRLLVDIDGDGIREAYVAASFLDPVRAPAEEVLAVSANGLQCDPSFAVGRLLPARDPKHFKGLDLIGVVDIDDDGRSELIAVYHYSDRRTWAVYTATSTVARLELVGEAVPWPVR